MGSVLTSAGFHPIASIIAWIPGLKQAPPGMTVLVGRRYNQNRNFPVGDELSFFPRCNNSSPTGKIRDGNPGAATIQPLRGKSRVAPESVVFPEIFAMPSGERLPSLSLDDQVFFRTTTRDARHSGRSVAETRNPGSPRKLADSRFRLVRLVRLVPALQRGNALRDAPASHQPCCAPLLRAFHSFARIRRFGKRKTSGHYGFAGGVCRSGRAGRRVGFRLLTAPVESL